MHSLIWDQFNSEAYTDMLRYSWRHTDPAYSAEELAAQPVPPMVQEISIIKKFVQISPSSPLLRTLSSAKLDTPPLHAHVQFGLERVRVSPPPSQQSFAPIRCTAAPVSCILLQDGLQCSDGLDCRRVRSYQEE